MFAVVRALITGIGGFVGRHLTAHLLESGDEVVGLDLTEVSVDGVSAVRACDIADVAPVGQAIGELAPDAIYHLAGAASAGASFDNALATWHVNLTGTLAVLEAVRTRVPNARALMVSSAEVYGIVPAVDLPVRSDTPMRPHSPYGASKLAADAAAGQYHDGYGLQTLRARPFNHIGPGQDPRFVVPWVAQQIATGERNGDDPIVVRVGNLDSRRDFLDVRDVVRAYRLIVDRGIPEHPYVIARGSSVSVGELIAGLATSVDRAVSIVSEASRHRPGEQLDLYGAPEQLHADTGWEPRYPLDQTLRDTLDSWRVRVAKED